MTSPRSLLSSHSLPILPVPTTPPNEAPSQALRRREAALPGPPLHHPHTRLPLRPEPFARTPAAGYPQSRDAPLDAGTHGVRFVCALAVELSFRSSACPRQPELEQIPNLHLWKLPVCLKMSLHPKMSKCSSLQTSL
ncbi:hypothetical protein GRJ2_000598700 [Grus japonensis]|uniref:Uncharacterized protein n=1 Tax=Grus japonensis TaxID=30415 RepID=A0ABC9W716_GRUJA